VVSSARKIPPRVGLVGFATLYNGSVGISNAGMKYRSVGVISMLTFSVILV
jgi:hypothetical protein